MTEAGLLARKQELTVAEVQKNLQTILGTEADTSAAMSVLGLSAAMEGQEYQTVQLTSKKLKELVTSHALTEAQAQELAMRTGVMLSMRAQTAGILPKWIATLKAATLATWGQVKATAVWLATTPAGWITAAVAAIGAAVAISASHNKKLEEQREAIKENAEAAKSAIDGIKSDFDSLNSATDDVKERFAELAQGVGDLGKVNQSRGELSTEDYKEFLELSNQIADLFPQLTKGYDDNGNAILGLSGNVDTIVGSLENMVSVQQRLARQEIMDKMPDVWAGYTADLEEYETSLEEAEKKSKGAVQALSEVTNGIFKMKGYDEDSGFINGELNDAIKTALENVGIGSLIDDWGWTYHYDRSGKDGYSTTWDFSSLTEAQFEQLKNELGSLSFEYENAVQITKGKMEAANSDMSNYINTWLSGEWNYSRMDSGMQDVVKDVLLNSDWISQMPVDSGDWDEVSNWLQQNFLSAVNKIDDMEIQSALADVLNGDSTTGLIQGTIDRLLNTEGFDEDNPLIIYLQTMFDNGNDLSEQVKEILQDEFDDRVDELTLDDLQIAAEQIKVDDGTLLSWDELIARINEYKETVKSPVSLPDIFSFKNADDTLTSLGSMSESIDTIQNAYKTLYEAIDEYNEEGAFSVDTLQSVIALGDDWLDYLADEDGNLKLNKESLEQLTQARLNDMRVQAINNVIDNVSKIESDADANDYLKSTNYALAESYEEVAQKALASARAKMQDAVAAGTLSKANMDAAMNKATADIAKINKLFANTSISTGTITENFEKSSAKSSSSKSEYEELFDFFERRVEVLDDALSLLKAKIENVTGAFGKNNLIDAEIGITEEKFNNYTDALSMYAQKAEEALSVIPSELAEKVKNGAVSLTDFIGDGNKSVVEAIKEYEDWSGKVNECRQELAELKETLRQLELEKFNNIMEDFTKQFDLREDGKDLISKKIALLEEAGQLIGESFFTAQIEQSKKQLELLEAEKAKLVEQMNTALSSGRVQKGTDEWLEMVNALSDVEGNILDCKKAMEEFDNSILALHTEIFNRIQEQFGNLDSELSNLIGLLVDMDVSDESGDWTKEGLAQLGLLAQQYELAQYQVQQYNDEINKLNSDYLAGKYSATEYADKLAELTSAQWDAVNAAESAKDAIMKLNEARVDKEIEGIEKEIDAYKELVDAQIDALKAAKDLHDYEETIAEKTKSITDLERQIAAMQNDNTAATVARRKKLEEELAQAKKDLEETEYDHSVEMQEDALNKEYERFEEEKQAEIEALRESLNEIQQMIAESLEAVRQNSDVIGQEIAYIAQLHGITVSDALISAWKNGEHAVAGYGEVLSAGTSAFIGNIIGVEKEIWNLQAQANSTAETLAWMFSTRADGLVEELNRSYSSEENLNAMTNALQSTLINTLERGYDISGITSALSAIASGADSVAGAANNAANALARMGAAGNTGRKKLTFVQIDSSTGESIYRNNDNGMEETSDYWKTYGWQYGISEEERNSLFHAKSGKSVGEGMHLLTKEQIERLLPVIDKSAWDLTAQKIPSICAINPPAASEIQGKGSQVNVHYDSMITINGDVNDTKHFLKDMENVSKRISQNEVGKFAKELNDIARFGRY